jgi:hypothetical protein
MTYQLSEQARETALRAARTMFPHGKLPDEAYARVIDQLEVEAAANDAVASSIEQGIAQLDDPEPFAGLDADARLGALARTEGSEFFNLLKATSVVELYDNPLVWRAFGYEGPSAHLGGYVNRGFADLDWLPDPPIELNPTAGSHHQ